MRTSDSRRVPTGCSSSRLTGMLVVCLLAAARLGASVGPTDTTSTAPAAIELSFRLDPRITKAAYMGDRWVSPPTYTRTGVGAELAVDARVECRDALGRPTASSPTWSSSNPDMVTVGPSKDSRHYEITVRRTGATTLALACGEVAKELSVTAATREGGGLLVEIAQGPASTRVRR